MFSLIRTAFGLQLHILKLKNKFSLLWKGMFAVEGSAQEMNWRVDSLIEILWGAVTKK